MGYSADKSPLIGHLAGPIRRLKPLGAQRQEKCGPNHLTREGLHATTPRIDTWSLTSLQQRLVKTGGRLVKHARYYWLLLAPAGGEPSDRTPVRRDAPADLGAPRPDGLTDEAAGDCREAKRGSKTGKVSEKCAGIRLFPARSTATWALLNGSGTPQVGHQAMLSPHMALGV